MDEQETPPDERATEEDSSGQPEVPEEPTATPTVASTARREQAPSERLKSILESLLFVSDRPVTSRELGRALRTDERRVRAALSELGAEYERRGVVLAEVAGGFQLRSSPDNATWVQSYLQARPVRLSRAALETLAIIAYRQPLTRPEVDDLRGVDCGGVMKLLLERGLIKIIGKKDEPGRPLLYGTTPAFLELFGLKSLRDLPTLRQFTELTEEHQAMVDRVAPSGDEPQEAVVHSIVSGTEAVSLSERRGSPDPEDARDDPGASMATQAASELDASVESEQPDDSSEAEGETGDEDEDDEDDDEDEDDEDDDEDEDEDDDEDDEDEDA